MSQSRAKIHITGRVQGVWFRQSTKEQARRHNVKGWCRNNRDGAVEGVFEGDADAVKALIDWCGQGPPAARVDNVSVTWEEATGAFTNFQIR